MMDAFGITLWQWVWIVTAAFLIGFSRTGIRGLIMPVIPILASVFGGKESTGMILPLLIVGDALALYYYRRHADWKNLKKLLPWTYMGLMLGAAAGSYINDRQFKLFIAVSVILCLIVLLYVDKKGENFKVPENPWFYAAMGALSGFTSMIGNAAGPIFSVYLLAMGMKKNDFMGTTAWFFFITNISKVPLQILFWNNIHLKTIGLTLILLPVIIMGALLGMIIIKKVSENHFRVLIIVMTAVSALKLMI